MNDDSSIMIPAVAQDGALYPVGKLEAHERGVLHLAVSAFLFDETGALLIQRRAQSKYHCPGLWANTCCTHPHWGEPLHSAVLRRMREELGFATILEERVTIEYRADVGGGLVENERVTLYRGVVRRGDVRLQPDRREVAETRWASAAELKHMLENEADILAPWFRIYLETYPGLNF